MNRTGFQFKTKNASYLNKIYDQAVKADKDAKQLQEKQNLIKLFSEKFNGKSIIYLTFTS